MKKIYWRPRAVSRTGLLLIAAISLAGLLLVEMIQVDKDRPYYDEKFAAAELAQEAFERIYYARVEVGPEIDLATDPAETGLIGVPMSDVTSVSGDLTAKQTTINPNWAAVLVEMLRDAGVAKGDVVAVGTSGSFPAMNICVYAALQVIGAEPIVISSAAASQWGANVPDLLWIDMERILHEEDIFLPRSVAVSYGGYEDRAEGLTEQGRRKLEEAIERNNLKLLYDPTFEGAVGERLEIYQEYAGRKPIKAYVNVGGGAVSVGRSTGKKILDPGLNTRASGLLYGVPGVAPHFLRNGVPVVHLVQIADLADQYGLPISPATKVQPGSGKVFSGTGYSNTLAITVLAVIILALYAFIRTDIGFRLLRTTKGPKKAAHPEPMV